MKTIEIPVSQLVRHRENARSNSEYRRKDVADLVASIRQHGLLQPLVVRQGIEGKFTLLAGHRRHAALKALRVEAAPCVVLEADESEALSVLLTDNAQHRRVDPMKEAEAIETLLGQLEGEKHPLDRASSLLGKSVAWLRSRLRLTALSSSWRSAFGDSENPISEFPIGHLQLIASVSDEVQEQAFAQWEGWWTEGVPLRRDIERMVADLTSDLTNASWDLDASDIVEGAGSCAACPKRESAQGQLFGGAKDNVRTSDRCLDSICFESKRRAVIYGAVEAALKKYGDGLVLEVPWNLRDTPMPAGVTCHQEHELVALTKKQGGKAVLRLRTMKVTYMAKASSTRAGDAGTGMVPLQSDGKPAKKSLAERKDALRKRRLIRALDLLQGTLMNRVAHIGSAKHPEEVVPPEATTPALQDLITYVLVYGTGPSVDSDADGYGSYPRDNGKEVERVAKQTRSDSAAADTRTRLRLWNRVREPMARALRTFSGMSLDATDRLCAEAERICTSAGLHWQDDFVAIATDSIPEPASWARETSTQF